MARSRRDSDGGRATADVVVSYTMRMSMAMVAGEGPRAMGQRITQTMVVGAPITGARWRGEARRVAPGPVVSVWVQHDNAGVGHWARAASHGQS